MSRLLSYIDILKDIKDPKDLKVLNQPKIS